MAGIYMLATNGLENLGVLEEVGEGIFRFNPALDVYFYDKRYDGPDNAALQEAVVEMIQIQELRKEIQPAIDQMNTGEGIPGKEVFERIRQRREYATKKEDNPSPLDFV